MALLCLTPLQALAQFDPSAPARVVIDTIHETWAVVGTVVVTAEQLDTSNTWIAAWSLSTPTTNTNTHETTYNTPLTVEQEELFDAYFQSRIESTSPPEVGPGNTSIDLLLMYESSLDWQLQSETILTIAQGIQETVGNIRLTAEGHYVENQTIQALSYSGFSDESKAWLSSLDGMTIPMTIGEGPALSITVAPGSLGLDIAAVPEPSAMFLALTALAGGLAVGWRRRRNRPQTTASGEVNQH